MKRLFAAFCILAYTPFAFGLIWIQPSRFGGPSVTPGWNYNISAAAASSDETTESAFTYGQLIVASQTCTVTKVSVRMAFANYAGQVMKAELYDHATNARLSTGSSYTNSGFQAGVDLEVTLGSPVSVTAGTSYRVEFAFSDSNFGSIARQVGGSGSRVDFSNGYSAFPQATSTTSSGSQAFRVGIYEQ